MEKAVGNYMVSSPYVCEPEWTLKDALEFMVDSEIRHLPVLVEGRLAGIVSERDLRAVVALPLSERLLIGDVMKQDVFVATRKTPLKDIVRTMQERKLGSTVVINDEREAIGIFTVTDALGILADLIDDDQIGFDASLDDVIEEWEWESVA